MVSTKQGKYMIKASTVLYITLQDYHQSRQQYGNEVYNSSDKNTDSNNKNNDYYDVKIFIFILKKKNNSYVENQQKNNEINPNKGAYDTHRPSDLFENYEDYKNPNEISQNYNSQNDMKNQIISNKEKYLKLENIEKENENNTNYKKFNNQANNNNNNQNNPNIKFINNSNQKKNVDSNEYEDKKSNLKIFISNYIKGKELDM